MEKKTYKNPYHRVLAWLLAFMMILGSFRGGGLVKAAEDTSFIVVEKTFSNIPEDKIPGNFEVSVEGANTYTLNKGNHNWEKSGSYPNIKWTWKIKGAGVGRYTVSENNYEVENYSVTASGLNSVSVDAVLLLLIEMYMKHHAVLLSGR